MCDEQEWLSSFSTFVPLTEKGSGKKTQWCFQQGKQNSWGEVEALILKKIEMEILEKPELFNSNVLGLFCVP